MILRRRIMVIVGGDIGGYVDLSMVDNAGNARASMTTANCYLVHKAGDYKLPLVYGNAIKNGTLNTVSFYPKTTGQLTRFINHAGEGITGPWITKSGSGLNAGMGLTAASAELLWQDVEGLISAVSVDGDYLNFTVGSFNPGNAVIAVKDGSGTILWSWHIWATSETLSSTIFAYNASYKVAAVNLGWVATGGSDKQGYCPYYQWGRKDPFIPCNGTTNGNTNKTVYNISGTSVTGITYQASTTATIADNIKNPTTHYYNSSNRGPCNTTYYNMWDAQNTASNVVRSIAKKTIYDPCPPGFCVPTSGFFLELCGNTLPSNENGTTSLNQFTWDSSNGGKLYSTINPNIYFPAVDYRMYNSGALTSVGSRGYYWSATPSEAEFGRDLYFNNAGWNWSRWFRASGFPIRPIAEE